MFNAFALGIGRVKGRLWIVVVILLANMLPQEVLLYPLYFMFKQVGLYDSQWAVIIIFTVIQSAFGTYLLASVYSTFPKELLEAASLDGASRWQILWRVVYPISRPTLSVLLIFFIWTWNEFLIPLTFLVSNATQTVPVAITVLQGDRLMDVTTTSASALLGLIPTLVFFLIFQRTLTGASRQERQGMKFTDGFWHARPGVEALYAQEARPRDRPGADGGDELVAGRHSGHRGARRHAQPADAHGLAREPGRGRHPGEGRASLRHAARRGLRDRSGWRAPRGSRSTTRAAWSTRARAPASGGDAVGSDVRGLRRGGGHDERTQVGWAQARARRAGRGRAGGRRASRRPGSPRHPRTCTPSSRSAWASSSTGSGSGSARS